MPRRPFTTDQAYAHGISPAALRWGRQTGRWQSVAHGVLLKGGAPPSLLEEALSLLVVTKGVASHSLAGVLHGLDGIELKAPYVTLPPASRSRKAGVKKRHLDAIQVHRVRGYPCTSLLQTVLDLAVVTNDLVWEQVLESSLRSRTITIDDVEDALSKMGASRVSGATRIRRVLALRPRNAPPTDSLLEILMVQLLRSDPDLPIPERQVEVFNRHGSFVGRVDLALPGQRIFIELDGQQHVGQPVYDAVRQTAIVACTRWLPARFTWDDVVKRPAHTIMRMRQLVEGIND